MSDLLIGMLAGAGISLVSVLASYWMFNRHQANQKDLRNTAMEILERLAPNKVNPLPYKIQAPTYQDPGGIF